MSNIILCADDSKTMQTVAEITFRASDFQYVYYYSDTPQIRVFSTPIGQRGPISIAAEIATGVPKPAAPSMNAPKLKAMRSACTRRSSARPATVSRP